MQMNIRRVSVPNGGRVAPAAMSILAGLSTPAGDVLLAGYLLMEAGWELTGGALRFSRQASAGLELAEVRFLADEILFSSATQPGSDLDGRAGRALDGLMAV